MERNHKEGKTCDSCGEPRSKGSKSLCAKCSMVNQKELAWAASARSTAKRRRIPVKASEMACVHHYCFPTSNGPVSSGTCKKCGDVTEGFNSIPNDMFSLHRKNNFSEDPAIHLERRINMKGKQ